MSKIPTRWATIDAAWGEGKKHIFCPDEKSLKFHKTEAEAKTHANKEIQEGCRMVAVLEVKTMFVARAIEYDQVS